jgi:CpeT protein
MQFLRSFVFLLAAGLLASCSSKLNTTTSTNPEDAARHKLQHRLMGRLAKMLEGNYTNIEQAIQDKEYRDMRLHIKRIWKNRSEEEGMYFYLEQATGKEPTQPFRQRVYHLRLRPGDDKVELLTYSMRAPKRFVGQWKQKEPLLGLNPDSLMLSEGCAMVMFQNNTQANSGFRGQTEGLLCHSDLNGADYMTTDLSVSPTELISWARGYNAAGAQVWGARSGGYVYKRERGNTAATPKSSDDPTPTKDSPPPPKDF